MTDHPLAHVLDAHTAAIDPEFLRQTCPDCGVTVAAPDLPAHLVTVHGHAEES